MERKIVIVGGVAGGATAAARLRRLSEKDKIILFERDEYISFANCGLPYYLGGVIQDRDRLIVESVENLSKKFALDIRNLTEVIAIDRLKKTVRVRNLRNKEEYEESYDKLILSTGASPIKLPLKGDDNVQHIFTLRNIPDTDKIETFIKDNKPKHAAIIGGGFIGVEMAENLTHRGIHCTIIDLSNQVMAPLDKEMAKIIENELTRHDVDLKLNDSVEEILDNGKKLLLKSRSVVNADLIIMAVGVKPESKLAKLAGLKLGSKGHVSTTPQLQTLDEKTNDIIEDIYAIGDVIEVIDPIDQSITAVPLAWPANRQGRLVADHINGKKVSYKGTFGTSIVKVFNLVAASTGNNEKSLIRKNIPHHSIMVTRGNHAGYYPGAQDILIKLIFNSKGKILGAQAVGGAGTDKRIDVISTAMKGGLNVEDLADLELAYAPPFSSAKDPVNIAGYAASNLLNGSYDVFPMTQIEDLLNKKAFIIDSRTKLEFELGHIHGAINLPYSEVRINSTALPLDKKEAIYVYCNVGHTAYLMIQVLKQYGYEKVFNLSGGYKLYKELHESPKKLMHLSTHEDIHVELKKEESQSSYQIDKKIDACGLQCPGPIMQTFKALESLKEGQVVQVEATESGYRNDIVKWCKNTGNTLLLNEVDGGIYRAVIQKGSGSPKNNLSNVGRTDATTIVLFSGDMDKALGALIIAQGAATMNKKVTIFATFWGLNLLRRSEKIKVKKSFIEGMFGWMMPRGPKKMTISKMNFAGFGTKLMRSVMKKKHISLIETQLQDAINAGVQFVACQMSMDVMGIKQEELIDGISYGGVATYLAESENAGVTLFI
jgi:CoA-disulfide reductase